MSARGSQGSPVAGFILAMVVLGFIIQHIVVILTVIAGAAAALLAGWLLVTGAGRWSARRAAERERVQEIAARAVQQHEACMRGDSSGVFGQYLPAALPEVRGQAQHGAAAGPAAGATGGSGAAT